MTAQISVVPGFLQGQLTPAGLDPIAVAGTVLLGWAFYAVTLHLAATFFIGDVPTQPAAAAGIVPAVVSVLLGQYGLGQQTLLSPGIDFFIALAGILVADAFAITYSYELSWKSTTALTALHFGIASVLIVALNNIFSLV